MKHISTIIDDLDLNDDLAHEYELDRRNDEFFEINSLVDKHIAKFPEKRWLFKDYRTKTYDECMCFLLNYYHKYSPVVQRLVCEILVRRFDLTTEEIVERGMGYDAYDEFFDAEAEMERRFEEEVERRYQAGKEVRNG